MDVSRSKTATTHAPAKESFDVRPFGPTLGSAKTTALFKSKDLEVIRLVIPRGKVIGTHKTRGEATIQCLEGTIALSTDDKTHLLSAGQLVHLEAGEPHGVRGIDDASLLVTIALNTSEHPVR